MVFINSNGYKVVRALGFDNGYGFAFGIDRTQLMSYAVWQYNEQDGKKILFNGSFFDNENLDTAVLNLHDRIKDYREENPGISDKSIYFSSINL